MFFAGAGRPRAWFVFAAVLSLLLFFSPVAKACMISTEGNWNSTNPEKLSFIAAPGLKLPDDASAVFFGFVTEERLADSESGFQIIETRIETLEILKCAVPEPFQVYRIPGQGGSCHIGPVFQVGKPYFVFIGPSSPNDDQDPYRDHTLDEIMEYGGNVYAAEYTWPENWLKKLEPLMSPDLATQLLGLSDE